MEDGPDSLVIAFARTNMVCEAPGALPVLDIFIDWVGLSRILASSKLHSCGIRKTVVERQEYKPGIEKFRAYLYALIPRGPATVRKRPKLFTALSKGTAASVWYSWCIIPLKHGQKS